MKLDDLSNAELLAGAEAECLMIDQGVARLLAYLGAIEHQGAHLEAACPSMFDYCTRKLRMFLTATPSSSRLCAMPTSAPRARGPSRRCCATSGIVLRISQRDGGTRAGARGRLAAASSRTLSSDATLSSRPGLALHA